VINATTGVPVILPEQIKFQHFASQRKQHQETSTRKLQLVTKANAAMASTTAAGESIRVAARFR